MWPNAGKQINHFSALSTSLPEKLYEAFQSSLPEESTLNVTEFLSGWVTQPGYPVITVNVFADRRTIVITQKKFLRNNPHHEDKTLWNIPITYATDKVNENFTETNATVHLTSEQTRIKLNDVGEWIVFNVQQTGECIRHWLFIEKSSIQWSNQVDGR